MDCGSGLLLLITRAMRRLEPGDLLGVRSAEPSVRHRPAGLGRAGRARRRRRVAETADGPWWFAVRKAGAPGRAEHRVQPRQPGRRWATGCGPTRTSTATSPASTAAPSPLRRPLPAGWTRRGGQGRSSTSSRDLGRTRAVPDRRRAVHAPRARRPGRGRRRPRAHHPDQRDDLRPRPPPRDPRGPRPRRWCCRSASTPPPPSCTTASAGPARGPGRWTASRWRESLGFRVRVAATMFDEDPVGVAALHERLDDEGIAAGGPGDPAGRRRRASPTPASTSRSTPSSPSRRSPPTAPGGTRWPSPTRTCASPTHRSPSTEIFGVVRDTARGAGRRRAVRTRGVPLCLTDTRAPTTMLDRARSAVDWLLAPATEDVPRHQAVGAASCGSCSACCGSTTSPGSVPPTSARRASNGLYKFTAYAVERPRAPAVHLGRRAPRPAQPGRFGWVVLVAETALAVLLLTGAWVRAAAALGVAQ